MIIGKIVVSIINKVIIFSRNHTLYLFLQYICYCMYIDVVNTQMTTDGE